MSNIAFTPLPPTTTHSTTRLTHSAAHAMLSAFLATAENEPSHRPDSILTTRGPVSSSALTGTGSGGGPNLTLVNLKRILKGLEGTRVGGGKFEVDGSSHPKDQASRSVSRKRQVDESEDGKETNARTGTSKRSKHDTAHDFEIDVQDGEAIVRPEDSASDGSGWQDPTAFELEQEPLHLDVFAEDRDPGAGLEQPENEEEEKELVEVEVVGAKGKGDSLYERGGKSGKDKEKRKEDKKARRKEEKAQRAKERRENKVD